MVSPETGTYASPPSAARPRPPKAGPSSLEPSPPRIRSPVIVPPTTRGSSSPQARERSRARRPRHLEGAAAHGAVGELDPAAVRPGSRRDRARRSPRRCGRTPPRASPRPRGPPRSCRRRGSRASSPRRSRSARRAHRGARRAPTPAPARSGRARRSGRSPAPPPRPSEPTVSAAPRLISPIDRSARWLRPERSRTVSPPSFTSACTASSSSLIRSAASCSVLTPVRSTVAVLRVWSMTLILPRSTPSPPLRASSEVSLVILDPLRESASSRGWADTACPVASAKPRLTVCWLLTSRPTVTW